ncbi:hypothetical protein AAC387_Pa07g2902 [Persea americana]
MEMESCVPPGFRFHPTEEELVGYYLTKKVASQKIDLGVITEIDLYRIEPWDLQERCRLGYEEQNEWYFFSHKDRKYPTGTRTNRATAAGFWKATGRDKAVISRRKIIGMRKTLVFYKGRAPNGRKTDWIMHEYRLQTSEEGPTQAKGWVVCRAFRKPSPNPRPMFNPWSNNYNDLQAWPNANYPQFINSYHMGVLSQHASVYNHEDPEELQQVYANQILELPQPDSPSLSTGLVNKEGFEPSTDDYNAEFADWKAIDKLLASQLIDPTSCSNSNLPVVPLDYGTDAPNQGTQFLGLFDDS